ncbi:MAG: helix-turn-helix domain-containing protein [Candidatus Neptunochlamydia sp.]|nr:helix-turn-helix domain-containing protein [Candidatus Neptunochlamydia sp.]
MKTSGMFGISDRHFRRLLKGYREEGVNGLLSKKRGKQSNRKIREKTREETISHLKNRYQGFRPSFATEKLKEDL